MFQKRLLLTAVCATMFVPPSAMASEVNPGLGATPIIGAGSGGAFVGTAGDYNIDSVVQDNTAVINATLDIIEGIQPEDRAYLEAIGQRMNEALNELEDIKVKMTELSQQSQSSGFILLNDLLLEVNKFNQRVANVENDMATYGSVSRETLPSYPAIVAGELKVEVPNATNIDLTPITERIEGSLELLKASVNLLEFPNVQSKTGQPVPITKEGGTVLKPHLKGITILTSEEISRLNQIAREKSTLAQGTIDLQDDFVNLTVTLIQRFVRAYGSDERFRIRNTNDEEAVIRAYEEIVSAFKKRSYLRRKYGIRLGAIQSKGFPKQVANLEVISSAITSFRREAAVSDAELVDAFENARNFVELYDRQRTKVFASGENIQAARDSDEQYAADGTGFITRVSSAATWIRGDRAVVESLYLVMRLVLSDIQEEMFLLERDDLSLKNHHIAKYRSNDAQKTEYLQFVCRNDHTLSERIHEARCATPEIGVKTKAKRATIRDSNTLGEIFSETLNQYETVERSKRQEARFAQEQIDISLAFAETEEDKQAREDLEDDLFD